MILGMENHLKYSVKIGPTTVKEFDEVELLEIIIDKVLNSRTNIYNLSSTCQYYQVDKAELSGDASIDTHFNYAPPIWMFCHKTTYLKSQKIRHNILK